MSSLWTPSGEHFPEKDEAGASEGPSPHPGDTDVTEPSPDEAQAEVDAMRAQLANTPAEIVVANHCYGLFELAAIYLSQTPPMLFQARLAIDALGFILDGLKDRLGEAEPALHDSLSQLRLAFVRLEGSERTDAQNSANVANGGPPRRGIGPGRQRAVVRSVAAARPSTHRPMNAPSWRR